MKYVWVNDQVWGQDSWMLAKFLFCVFLKREEVEIHKFWSKKGKRTISSHLDRTNLVNKGFIIWLSGKMFLGGRGGWSQGGKITPSCVRSGSKSERRIWFILPARLANHITNRLAISTKLTPLFLQHCCFHWSVSFEWRTFAKSEIWDWSARKALFEKFNLEVFNRVTVRYGPH